MSSNYYTRDNCRLCFSNDVEMIYEFPKIPPVDDFRTKSEINDPVELFPMNLHMCKSCGHAQLLDVVDPNILFGNYIYTSSSSPDLDKHFTAYADKLIDRLKLSEDNFVIDIGSNDGLFLSKFKSHGIQILGIDASQNAADVAIKNGIPTLVSFIDAKTVELVKARYGAADVVTANNVFSHSDDLTGFLINASNLLKDKGFFVFEVSYLKCILDNKVIDYVYHEHLAHHSIKPMRSFLERNGMRLIDVDFVPTKGGSIRCYGVKADSGIEEKPIVQQMIDEEEAMGLYNPGSYKELKAEIDTLGKQTYDVLAGVNNKGGEVMSYGASATATVINYLFDINKFFSAVIDDNPLRQGRFSPGCHVEVKPKAELIKSKPEMVIISSWRFADMIIKNNQAYLDQGGCFLVPLPSLRIVKK